MGAARKRFACNSVVSSRDEGTDGACAEVVPRGVFPVTRIKQGAITTGIKGGHWIEKQSAGVLSAEGDETG